MFSSFLLGVLGFNLHVAVAYEVKAWQNIGPDTMEMKFPEEDYADVTSRRNVGLSLSGGGDRAFISSIGVLGALHELGMMKEIRYIVGVSGGSWATSVYSYYQKSDVSDTTMLGEIIFPEDIVYDELHFIDKDCVRSYPNSSYVLQGVLYSDWVDGVQEIYLTPSDIPRGKPVSYNADSVADIKSRNPSLQDTDFLLLRGGGSGIDARPFPIISTTLIGPDDLLPYTPENRNYTLLEFTPLSTGVVKSSTVHFESTQRFGGQVTQTVGGLLESFAFGTDSAPTTGLEEGTASGILELPDSALTSDLAMAAGSSSWAVGCAVAASDNPVSQATVGSLNYFAPSGDSPAEDFDVFLIGDGAGISNTNLISLLQRDVDAIIAIVSTSVPMQNSTHWDPAAAYLSQDDIDFTVPAWFGRIADDLSDVSKVSYDLENSHVFELSEWVPMAQALQKAQAAGTGNVASMVHTTVANEKYGIKAGKKVNVMWVYLGRCTEWEKQLSDDMYARVVPTEDPSNQASIIDSGMFKNFPHYTTSLASNNIRRSNLLADLMGWVIYQNADKLDEITHHTHSDSSGDDDEPFMSSLAGIIVITVVVVVALVVFVGVGYLASRTAKKSQEARAGGERQSELTTSPVHDINRV
jgi:hypothetical protein